MVAGKVKSAMGLQKTQANTKINNEEGPPKPPLSVKNSAAKQQQVQKGSGGGGASLSRSLGIYFPRSSAQVQPRPTVNVTELVRLVEELRERESRLKIELLEQKLLKESAAIVPILETEISNIEWARKKVLCLEEENERLRQENEFLHVWKNETIWLATRQIVIGGRNPCAKRTDFVCALYHHDLSVQ